MKKLLVVLFTLFTLQSYSQGDAKIEDVKFSTYNSYTEKYEYYTTRYPQYPTYLTISESKTRIVISGEVTHIYKLTDVLQDTYQYQGFSCMSFSGFDEDGDQIAISVCTSARMSKGFMLVIYPKKYMITYDF